MKHRKKTSKRFRDEPHKSGMHVYKVQYQTIHVTRLPLKDPDNPKAPPQEVRHTEEHVQHVLAADRFAAADYVKSPDNKDDHIHINLVTEVAHDVEGGGSLGHKAVKGKQNNKRRKGHGFNRNAVSRRRNKSRPGARSTGARKTKGQKGKNSTAKGKKANRKKINRENTKGSKTGD